MTVETLPEFACSVLERLELAGYQAFLVGGCVRDILRGTEPHDFDICTSALPEEILSLFPGSIPTGIKHGTVTVAAGESRLEVTTFRSDGAYKDRRRPESVTYIADIEEDLKRRDFTMNAVALSRSGEITDPFNGQSDIKARIIRCVGDPLKRFDEDALRMFRAFRFSARFDFEPEPETIAAIYKKAELAQALAPERIRSELEGILTSGRPGKVFELIRAGLMDSYLRRENIKTEYIRRFEQLPSDFRLRLAGFCTLLFVSGSVADPSVFLRSLRHDAATIKICSEAVEKANGGLPCDMPGLKRLMSRCGTEVARCAAAAANVLTPCGYTEKIEKIIVASECFSLKDLAVNGDDLSALGFSGKELGEELFRLLDHVIDTPEDNNKKTLIDLASHGRT